MFVKDKITKARAGLILDRPFYGSLALRLKLIEDPTCKTGWVDGRNLGYNPEWIDSLTLAQTKGFICHEILHIVFHHNTRRGNREPRKWNYAGDLVINNIIEDDKIELPPGGLLDASFKDTYTEEAYSRIPDLPDEKDGQGNSDPGRCGEIRDSKNPDGSKLTKAQKEQDEQQWKVATVQAAQAEKALKAGHLPAGIKRLLDEILEPKADWKTILQIFVQQTARNDYSWSKPNKRYQHLGFTLPTLQGEELPPVVIAVDTSGSISKNDVNQFAAEISDILEEYKTKCTVIYCDTQIAHVESFESDDLPLQLNPKGGGGTNFVPPFEYVEEKEIDPSCLIYLTDLCCLNYPEEPDYPVLWAKIGKWGNEVPWGEVIEL